MKNQAGTRWIKFKRKEDRMIARIDRRTKSTADRIPMHASINKEGRVWTF